MSAICLMSRDSRATCGASTSQGTPWSCLHQEPLADVLAWDSYSGCASKMLTSGISQVEGLPWL